MYPSSSSAYDRAITVFSPDGRLFQVEYAREAVKRGTTAVGMVFKDGGILATDKNVQSKLIKAESIEKVFKIDDHIGVATSGLVADARRIVHFARVEAQREKVAYNEPVSVEAITKEICNLKQMYTQYGGTRPFGTALLILGVHEKGARLFETDPSGAFTEAYATAIGSGKKEVEGMFEKEYSPDMSLDDAIKLTYKALKAVGDKNTSLDTIVMYKIDDKKKMFERISVDHAKKVVGVKK